MRIKQCIAYLLIAVMVYGTMVSAFASEQIEEGVTPTPTIDQIQEATEPSPMPETPPAETDPAEDTVSTEPADLPDETEQQEDMPVEETTNDQVIPEEEVLEDGMEEDDLMEDAGLKDAAISEGSYVIQSALSANMVLDIAGGSTANKANLQIYKKNGTPAQRFVIHPLGGGLYEIVNEKSGRAMDVANGKMVSKTNVQQYTRNHSAAQTWAIASTGDGYVRIVPAGKEALSLDVAGGKTANKTNVRLYTANNTKAQKFKLVRQTAPADTDDKEPSFNPASVAQGYYFIHSGAKHGGCLDIASGSTTSGANVQLYARNFTDAQRMRIMSAGNGTYTITVAKSGRVLAAQAGGKTSRTNVCQESANKTDAQRWVFESAGSGMYYIRNYASGLYLDAQSGQTSNKTNVQLYTGNKSKAQKWELEETALVVASARTIPDGYYQFSSIINEGLSFDVQSLGTEDGTNIQLYTTRNEINQYAKAQTFRVIYSGSGMYRIISVLSNKLLATSGGSITEGANVEIATPDGSDAQKWKIEKRSDGSYQITSAVGSYSFAVEGDTLSVGTNIALSARDDEDKAQGFVLKSISFQETLLPAGGFGSTKTLIPDISHYEPVQDWTKVKNNCAFLITKATQGTTFIDNTLNSFITNCEKNKIPYWLYTFLNKGDEVAQVKFMISVCSSRVGPYFRGYVLDVERSNDPGNVLAALNYLKARHEKCIVYTGYSGSDKYFPILDERGDNVAWWQARYGTNDGTFQPNAPARPGADLHQYTSKASIPGIGATVDANRLTGNKALTWFTETK